MATCYRARPAAVLWEEVMISHQTGDVRMSTFTLTTTLHTEKERPVTCNNVMNSILDL